MKKSVLIILLLMVVLITGTMPQSVYGADDEDNLLTTDEIKFHRDMMQRILQAFSIISSCRSFTSAKSYREYKGGQYTLFWKNSKSDVEIWRDFKERFDFDFSCSVNSAPSTFKDIQTDWNTNICPKFAKIRLIVEREFVPSITLEGWLALGEKIGEECDYLYQLVDNLERKYILRKEELQQQRKKAGITPKDMREVEQEVKKGLSPKDEAGKPKDTAGKPEDDFCFIATAAYGTPTAVEIDELRRFRDEYLRKSSLGNEFIKFYYKNSPPIAKFISEHEILRVIVREGFVEPAVKLVELTENYWAE